MKDKNNKEIKERGKVKDSNGNIATVGISKGNFPVSATVLNYPEKCKLLQNPKQYEVI